MKIRLISSFSLAALMAVAGIAVVRGNAGTPPAHALAAQAVATSAAASAVQSNAFGDEFRLHSDTFQNGGSIPASMVFNGELGSVCMGGNTSPELSWTHGPRGTRTYAVALFDVTASFTHWGVYNLPPSVTNLPAGAGADATNYPNQITNDAYNFGYSGPCPPPGLVPNGIHAYVFTVYALDAQLKLPSPTSNFPPSGAALYRAMNGHVLDSASITGLFKCTDSSSCS